MTTRAAKSATAEEIAAIEDLMGDLEKRLRRLSGTARNEVSGAAGDVRRFVSEALEHIITYAKVPPTSLPRLPMKPPAWAATRSRNSVTKSSNTLS